MKANCRYNNWYEDTIMVEVDFGMLTRIEKILRESLIIAVENCEYYEAQKIIDDLLAVIERLEEYAKHLGEGKKVDADS